MLISNILLVPAHTRYGDRAFSVATPKLWNSLVSLQISVRNATSIDCFKSGLQRFLFKINSPNLLLWPSLSFVEMSLFQLFMPVF